MRLQISNEFSTTFLHTKDVVGSIFNHLNSSLSFLKFGDVGFAEVFLSLSHVLFRALIDIFNILQSIYSFDKSPIAD